MDPKATLENAREALKRLRSIQQVDPDAAEDLADAFEALDQWLMKGGFSPW